MVRESGKRLSLHLDASDAVEFTAEWWAQTTQTLEGLALAYEMIRDTVRDRDQLLVIQEDHEIQV
jgi:hypothetical protein